MTDRSSKESAAMVAPRLERDGVGVGVTTPTPS